MRKTLILSTAGILIGALIISVIGCGAATTSPGSEEESTTSTNTKGQILLPTGFSLDSSQLTLATSENESIPFDSNTREFTVDTSTDTTEAIVAHDNDGNPLML